MTEERNGGWALIVGAAMGLVTMAFHPSGAQMLRDFERNAPINVAVHTLALLAVPVTFFGAVALARRLAVSPGLSRFALIVFGMAQIAVMVAAVASGLLATMLVSRILTSTGAEAESARLLLSFSGMLNHAFATVFVVASSIAIGVWSVAMWRARDFPRWLAWLGLLVGSTLVGITLLGRLRLDVHHFGLVVLAQSVWIIGTGITLVRLPRGPSGGD